MPLTVLQFPCLDDNYGFLARDEASGLVATIDTPDAEVILAQAKQAGWTITHILNTHWHPDHAGGNAAIQAATGAISIGPAEVERLVPLDQIVTPGETVMLGETRFDVMDVGGHTLQHIAYIDAADAITFVGDSLFTLGCGRMFEGDPVQMWGGLSRLAALPPETRVYCAHEYTAANARFALSVDQAPETRARADSVFAARERGEATVPTTIGAELAANPFLRAPLLRPDMEPAQAFADLRAAKDVFKG
jgi:hydroxyacylglutathione hydrolase